MDVTNLPLHVGSIISLQYQPLFPAKQDEDDDNNDDNNKIRYLNAEI